MNIDPRQFIKDYRKLLRSFDLISFTSSMVMVVASTWYLWIPTYVRQLSIQGIELFGLVILLYLTSFLVAKRLLTNPQSVSRYFFGIVIIFGILYQQSFGINTLYPILIVSLAVIIKTQIDPILQQIYRTQHYSSSKNVSEEILIAFQHSYTYLIAKRTWLFNLIVLEIVLAMIIILAFTINELITLFLDPIIIQYVFLIIFLISFVLVVVNIYPDIDTKDEYQLYLEGQE